MSLQLVPVSMSSRLELDVCLDPSILKNNRQQKPILSALDISGLY